MLPRNFSFVDVETTGTSPQYGKIIEIGIIRVENGQVVQEYSSLINPSTHVDPFILEMTGINADDLEDAPSFYQVKDQIKKLFTDSVFVAHNAMFDYSFIKQEFQRLDETFAAKQLCTVKLSRKLYPRFKHHNLDSIIERFNFKCERRHRALDDTKVMFDFFNLSLKNLGEEKLSAAIQTIMKRPSLPIGLSEQVLDSLPEAAGVYIFYNKQDAPLYIGKSINLRDRVMSHFSNSKRDNLDLKIAADVARVETIETAGELGALLLEATLVKQSQPLYNRKLRYAFKLLALKKTTTTEGYHSISVVNLQEVPVEELNQVLGIFKSKKQLKEALTGIAKEYSLCLKQLGLESTTKNCFNFHINLCKGACTNLESTLKYNLRFDEAFYKTKIKDWPFEGPIAIKEQSDKEEVFVIDKWCVLGKLKSEADSLDDISREYLFDTDTYRILNRYLNGSRNFKIL